MEITNTMYNTVTRDKELKEILVFNYKSINSINHDTHLLSFSQTNEVLKVYGDTLKGRWKIKQLSNIKKEIKNNKN